MNTITVGHFKKHVHDVLYQRYDLMIVEPGIKKGGIIAQAGLMIDEDSGYILKICMYDHFTESYYCKSLNVQWADERNRSWLASVLVDQFVDLIYDVRTKTQKTIKGYYNNVLTALGVDKI